MTAPRCSRRCALSWRLEASPLYVEFIRRSTAGEDVRSPSRFIQFEAGAKFKYVVIISGKVDWND